MSIPKRIKIDAVTYDVIITSETIVVEGKQCKGSIDYNKNSIKVADFLGEEQAKVTLMHELLHGMVYERGISLATSEDETIVDELGKAMMQVIRDNPELITYLND